jgi:uncharacterized protein YydD (DUF2326 family)
MFLKNLKIATPFKIIRDIHFHAGLNLIVDNTPTTEIQQTGNNVGKTTVLKLVDFCLGAKLAIIYTDPENPKDEYKTVKDFLINNNVMITLTLVENLDDSDSNKLVIERNFLSGKEAIRRINGDDIPSEKELQNTLMSYCFPNFTGNKPTFRQIISHNIRYRDDSLNNTLKTLDRFTTNVEYETLYLFLLNCPFDEGEQRKALLDKIKHETEYRDRLEETEKTSTYEVMLNLLDNEIKSLNQKKSLIKINENFQSDLTNLNDVHYKINRVSSVISKLSIRKYLILEAKTELEKNSVNNIDFTQLKILYGEARNNIDGLHKTFEDLVNYHNKMLVEKIKFMTLDLPDLDQKIHEQNCVLNELLEREKKLSEIISESDSFEDLEKVIAELNEKYQRKGEYEKIIKQIDEVNKNIRTLEQSLGNIDSLLFSPSFEEKLKKQRDKFNIHFSAVSSELYGESYALKYDKTSDKNTHKPYYHFSAFNTNLSSGKKQGEILCFDLAYTLFADEEKIPCMHFLLNDKKELMHDNQLLQVAKFVRDKNVQLVISILKDKLPTDLLHETNIIVELSQEKKLFLIEQNDDKNSQNTSPVM